MPRIPWVIVWLLLLVACSTPPSNEGPGDLSALPPSLPVTTPPDPTPDTSTSPTSAQSPATNASPTPSAKEAILSDLMKKVRDTIGPLLRGGAGAESANAQMEELFRKIQECAPEDWDETKRGQWITITEGALQGTPDARGLKPWSKACKKCHDVFRDEYKERYHTRIIPVIP